MKKLLIANRGEIAMRIMATARRMGIRTVAVYHSLDAGLPYVAEADEAVLLQGETLAETYLNGKMLVEAAKSVRADAIHPGYGFLSENAEFAHLCKQSGITFVGPTPEVLAIMGDKITSRSFAQSLGVPVIHGYEGLPDEIIVQVQPDDFPLLVKPALGGGGKGMKVARNIDELKEALDSASREAHRYFSSNVVYVEHLILFPRHIEVQIIADNAGNVLHLFDRECTLQRRFQKVVEEAPSPSLNEVQRQEAYEISLRLAKECGYTNAGTIEFLLDSKGKLFFLEMNTRIQVEHPVTEMITGVDIVEQQLLVAMGKPLRLSQSEVKISGTAIELRLMAEDAERRFLPSAGIIRQLHVPSSVRFDYCYRNGDNVSSHFDSLIGKMVIHAHTRADAIAKSIEAVEQSSVHGIKTNLPFLRQLLRSKPFKDNRIHVDFIDRTLADIISEIKEFRNSGLEHLLLAAFLHVRSSAWQLFFQSSVRIDERWVSFFAARTPNGYYIKVGEMGKVVEVKAFDGHLIVVIEGEKHLISYSVAEGEDTLTYKGIDFSLKSNRSGIDNYKPEKKLSGFEKQIVSPLNGKIVEVKVKKGQQVSRGALLLVVESMKMENSIFAPADAVIGEVYVKVSQQVQGGSTLLNLE